MSSDVTLIVISVFSGYVPSPQKAQKRSIGFDNNVMVYSVSVISSSSMKFAIKVVSLISIKENSASSEIIFPTLSVQFSKIYPSFAIALIVTSVFSR